MRVNTDDKKKKRKLILSGAALVISALLLAISYAWFCTQREMTTAAWIKAPIVLDIRAGNDKEIKYLDMGDIEVGEGKNGSKDYVFCVYGKPVDNYSLQLAYTTNIAFHYDVYRADLKADGSGKVTFESPDNRATFDIVGNPVISGLSMNEIKAKNESPAKYQSHALSYGDEKKENIVARTKVQANNEPLYFLAEENGIKVMRPCPDNIIDGKEFLDYYVIRVSWKKGEVHEDKETDIVYLTVSR